MPTFKTSVFDLRAEVKFSIRDWFSNLDFQIFDEKQDRDRP